MGCLKLDFQRRVDFKFGEHPNVGLDHAPVGKVTLVQSSEVSVNFLEERSYFSSKTNEYGLVRVFKSKLGKEIVVVVDEIMDLADEFLVRTLLF